MTNVSGTNLNNGAAVGPQGEGMESPSSFPKYPTYKNSGVEWLSDVPEHWSVRRNKHVFRVVSVQVGNKSSDFQLLSLTLRGVIPRDIEGGKGKFPAEFDTYQTVEPNDLVFCLFDIDETPRTVGISRDYGMITGAYTVAKSLSIADARYIYYYYFSVDLRKGLRPFYTGLRKVVRPETFLNIEMPLPSLQEQTQIARFLDHETARIDALIAEQQRLIELLKEKRQAVISHAVTKGLNPNAPMKDSGVEWLGQVPAHWQVKKIRHYGRLLNGYAFKSTDFTDEGHPVIKISNVGHLGFDWIDSSFLPKEYSETHFEFTVPNGALVFAMTRPVIAGGIKVAKWIDDSRPLVNQRVGFMTIEAPLMSDYLLVSTQSDAFLHQFKNNLTVTNQPNISSEGIEGISIPVPPENEIESILNFCMSFDDAIHSLTQEAVKGIDLLLERRSALISAAVTGKIDVRGWQPPASTAPALEQETH